jgi:hypothetical protein
MTYNLFIDDERDPHEVTWGGSSAYQTQNWVIARSATEAIELIRTLGFPALISFDHDLGDGPSGYDAAKMFVDFVLDGEPLPSNFKFYIHSKNPVGAENIKLFMNNFLEVLK